MVVHVTYALEQIICYAIAYRMIFRMNFSNKLRSFLTAACVVLAQIIAINAIGQPEIVHAGVVLYGLVVPLVLAESKKIYWLSLYPTIFLGVTIIDLVISLGYGMTSDITVQMVYMNTEAMMVSKTLCLVIMILAFPAVKYMLWMGDEQIILKQRSIIMFDVVCFTMYLMIASVLRLTSNHADHEKAGMIVQLSMLMAAIWILFLISYSLFLAREREHQKDQIEAYDMLANEQKKQVESILVSDEEMRKLRHDIKAHITAIRGLCESSNSSEAVEYCDQLLGEIHLDSMKMTGDPAVDAVLSSMQARAQYSGIEIEYHIQSAPDDRMRSFDMCTIVSNLLRNAIEACGKVDGEQWIKFGIYKMHNRLCVKVSNPAPDDVIIEGNDLITTKSDKEHHGYGIRNVKMAVQKYSGKFRYRIENGVFEAMAII